MTEYSTGKHCHKMVAETAKGIAEAFVEFTMQDNEQFAALRAAHPDLTTEQTHKELSKRLWPQFIEQARATLAKMLAGPMEESLKEQIAQALILDNTLRRRRDRSSAGFRAGAPQITPPSLH